MENHPSQPPFPRLEWNTFFPFPPPETADAQGLLAVGGNFSPGLLLSAYRQGAFPWYSDGQPILWFHLDPRFVLYPDKIHVSHSLKKILKHSPFEVTFDRQFRRVMSLCGTVPRPGQHGTWVTLELLDGYSEVHDLGFAHSIEVWLEGELVGGLFGMRLGKVFYGESMFSLKPNASKVGFATAVDFLAEEGVRLIDCQAHTRYLESFGAEMIPRSLFVEHLTQWSEFPGPRGSWAELSPGTPGRLE